jgi:photosystem II stability/assembly factor-like uncharacterized protein
VFVVTAHPDDPSVVFAGTDEGIFRSDDRGKSFKKIESQMDSLEVWRIAFDPTNPDNIFTGTSPSALFRSRDGGTKWEKLPVDMAETCPNVRVPRVTALVVDPADPNIVWAGVEVDGVRRSLDGGDTWSRINGGPTDPDIHGIAVSTGSPKTVLTSTPGEIFSSTDAGESWQGLGVRKHFEFPYCREITVKKNDPNVLFVAAGEGPFGSTGNIQRSKDRGQTWEAVPLPVEPNTPIWAFSGHAADPDFMMACSHYGELYTTSNGGDSWDKLRKEFTEVRSIAWTPN